MPGRYPGCRRARSACGAALAVVLASGPARAEPPGAATRPEDRAELSMGEVMAIAAAADILSSRGATAFDAGDAAEAATQWELAYELLGTVIGLEEQRQGVGFHLARAHLGANDTDHDPRRLERARLLLRDVITYVQRPEHVATPAERERVEHARAMMEVARYRLLEDRVRAAQQLREAPPPPEPSPARLPTPVRAWIGVGAGGLGIAAVLLTTAAGLGASAPSEQEADRRGERLRVGATATLALGVVALVGGGASLAWGLTLRRRALHTAPTFARGGAGVALAGRF